MSGFKQGLNSKPRRFHARPQQRELWLSRITFPSNNVQSSWSHPVLGLDEDVDDLQREHAALRRTESSVIGFIFILMKGGDRESSENRREPCGLSWCLSTNLAAPASLLLTPCWHMLVTCLHFAVRPRGYQQDTKAPSGRLRPSFIVMDTSSLKSLDPWRSSRNNTTTAKLMSCFHKKGNMSQRLEAHLIEQVEHRKLQHNADIRSEKWLLFCWACSLCCSL